MERNRIELIGTVLRLRSIPANLTALSRKDSAELAGLGQSTDKVTTDHFEEQHR